MSQVALFEEIGAGCLYLSGSGQYTSSLQKCPVAIENRPSSKDRVDTAYIVHYDNTDFYQWYGRKGDGRFHAIGKILRLTPAGKAALSATVSS